MRSPVQVFLVILALVILAMEHLNSSRSYLESVKVILSFEEIYFFESLPSSGEDHPSRLDSQPRFCGGGRGVFFAVE